LKKYYKELHELNNRIGKLQREGKIKALKKLRTKRRNLLLDLRRNVAKELGKVLKYTYVYIGYPKNIRENNYKGNGNRKQRKMINRLALRELGRMIISKVKENNGDGEWIGEGGQRTNALMWFKGSKNRK